jgi:integrase
MGLKHRTGHLFRRGKNFYLRWTIEGKVFSKALRDKKGSAITTKREAKEAQERLMAPFAVANEAEVLESIVGKLQGRKAELEELEDEQSPPLVISQAWSTYLESPSRPDTGPQTLIVYEYQFGKFTEWMKEKHPELVAMRYVTKDIAEEYASILNHGKLTPNTYNKHLNVLTMVFRVLKDKAKLTANPWEAIQRKRLTPHSRRELTLEELKKVCQNATGELRTLFALGVYTGLRQGDCATLRWGEVDLQRGVIRRVPNKTARRNPKPVIVPIHQVLRDMLLEIPVEPRNEYVLPKTADLYLNHRRMLVQAIQDHFTKCKIAVHKTGVHGRMQPVVEVGFHSLRHTFVSLCRESNAPLAVVESIVGHSNPAMTRHYTHVGELAAGRAVAALPTIIGEAKPEPPKRDAEAVLTEARAIAETITEKNWSEKKAALLTILKLQPEVGRAAPANAA